MNTRGLISSRSDVIALLSGELLQLRTEKSIIFKTSYHWEPHYFLLTSIGILKFVGANMTLAPQFVPLKNMIEADIIENEATRFSTDKIIQIVYRCPDAPGLTEEMLLSSDTIS